MIRKMIQGMLSAVICLALCHCVTAATHDPAQRDDGVYRGHGLAMHGDLKYGPDFKHFEYVNPQAPKGGGVRMGTRQPFDSFNGFILKGTPAPGLGYLYNSLMNSSRDEPFSEYGLLAEIIETPQDRSWVVFHLRKDATWHDGEPVTADDVVFTFDTLIEKGHPGYRFYYKSVEAVEKLGPFSVKFTFKADQMNRELPLIMGQLSILPKHYWENRDFTATTLEPPLGSGPYRIKSFEAGKRIVYERVEDYWGANHPLSVGMNNFDEIRYDCYRDEVVIFEAFKTGAIDYRTENIAKNWATGYDVPAVKRGYIIKQHFTHKRTAGMQSFALNIRKKLFADRRVRRALSHAMDFEWMNSKLFHNSYTRCRSFFGNSDLEAKGLPEGEELGILRRLDEKYPGHVPSEVFSQEYNPPATGNVADEREHRRALRKNLGEAAELLKQAGWHVRKSDKKLVSSAFQDDKGEEIPFAFEILLVQPSFERIALPFARNLEKLGIEASVRTVHTAQYQKRAESFDFDMIVGSWGQSMSPGNEQLGFWGSKAAATEGSRNLVGIRNPAVDEAIELVIEAPNRKSLVERTRALDRLLQWGYYVIPQWYLPYDRVAYWDKFGRPSIVPMRGTSLSTWWIDPAKSALLEERRKNNGK